jgi:lysylphosphatidylglycerol synthetase-like protein (DUF2156 family)
MDIGLTAIKLGEEARVDLLKFDIEAKGKEMKDLRYTWNRGGATAFRWKSTKWARRPWKS